MSTEPNELPRDEPTPGAGPAPDARAPLSTSRSAPWGWALIAGLIAGAVAAAAGEATYNTFEPAFVKPPNWDSMDFYQKQALTSAGVVEATPAAASKNAALAYGVLAGLLGGAMGLAGGLARRSAGASLAAAAAGLVFGALAASAAGAAAIPIFYRYIEPDSSLLLPALTHLAIFVPAGAAAGLALGLGVGGRGAALRGLFGGMLGAVVGTVAFEVIIAAGFPMTKMLDPIPVDRTPRLVVHVVMALAIALTAAWSLAPDRRRTPAA